jgi:hypothetical protein
MKNGSKFLLSLLKEVLKSLTGILRAAGRGRSLSFDTFLSFKKATLVTGALVQNSLWDGARAFETGRGVKKGTLLTTVKVSFTLRTMAFILYLQSTHGSTHGTAKNLPKAWHRLGAKFFRTLGLEGPLLLRLLPISIHITSLSILPFHRFSLMFDPSRISPVLAVVSFEAWDLGRPLSPF